MDRSIFGSSGWGHPAASYQRKCCAAGASRAIGHHWTVDSKRDDVAHCSPKNQDVNQDIELTSESLNISELPRVGGPWGWNGLRSTPQMEWAWWSIASSRRRTDLESRSSLVAQSDRNIPGKWLTLMGFQFDWYDRIPKWFPNGKWFSTWTNPGQWLLWSLDLRCHGVTVRGGHGKRWYVQPQLCQP